jgi:hypothetical protein
MSRAKQLRFDLTATAKGAPKATTTIEPAEFKPRLPEITEERRRELQEILAGDGHGVVGTGDRAS